MCENDERKRNCHILGIKESATFNEIKAAYRRKQLIYHPDKGGDEEVSKLCNLAYSMLKDSTFSTSDDFESASSGFSHLIRTSVENSKREYKNLKLADNFYEFYSRMFDDVISRLQFVRGRRNDKLYCRLCDSTFSSAELHYNEILHPYVKLLFQSDAADSSTTSTNGDNSFHGIMETKLGHEAFNWKPELSNQNLQYWGSLQWNKYKKTKNEIESFEDIIKNAREMVQLYTCGSDKETVDVNSSKPDYSYRYRLPNINLKDIKLEKGKENCKLHSGEMVAINKDSLNVRIHPGYKPTYTIQEVYSSRISSVMSKCYICHSRFIFTKLQTCPKCGGSYCVACQVRTHALKLGFNSKIKVCTICDKQLKTQNALVWTEEAKKLLHDEHYSYCRLYLRIAYLSVGDEKKRGLYDWHCIAETAFHLKQYGIFMQASEYYKCDKQQWIGNAKRLAIAAQFNLAATCLHIISKSNGTQRGQGLQQNEWIELVCEFARMECFPVATFCIKNAQMSATECFNKLQECKRVSQKAAHFFLEKCMAGRQSGMQQTLGFFQDKDYEMALLSCRYNSVEDLVKLANELFESKSWLECIVVLVYLNTVHETSQLETDNLMMTCLLWTLRKEGVDPLEGIADKYLKSKCFEDACTIVSFLEVFWKVDFKVRSQIVMENGLFDLATMYAQLERIKNRHDEWLFNFGMEIYPRFPEIALVFFTLGSYGALKIAEFFEEKGEFKVAILFYLKEDLTAIQTKAIELMQLNPEVSRYYFSAIFRICEDRSNYEGLLNVIDDLFPIEDRLSVYKAMVRQHTGVLIHPSATRIHKAIINAVRNTNSSSEDELNVAYTLLGGIHFLPPEMNKDTRNKIFKDVFSKKLKMSFNNTDFDLLGVVLPLLTEGNTEMASKVYKEILQAQELSTLPSASQAILLLIQGTICKVNKKWPKAVKYFEYAIECAEAGNYTDSVLKIVTELLQHSAFNEYILMALHKEIKILRNNMKENIFEVDLENANFLNLLTTGCSPRFRVIEDLITSKKDIQKIYKIESDLDCARDSLVSAYSYMDLYDKLPSVVKEQTAAIISGIVLLKAASGLLQAVNESEDAASIYAYRNAIVRISEECVYNANENRAWPPFLRSTLMKWAFTFVMQANKKLSASLNDHGNTSRTMQIEMLISQKDYTLLKFILNNFINIAISNPAVNIQHYLLRIGVFCCEIENKAETDATFYTRNQEGIGHFLNEIEKNFFL